MGKVKAGITFENTKSGEVRVCETVEHIAAYFNSSNLGPNAHAKQDHGWKLSPEDVIELEEVKNDPTLMMQIAQVYQIPPEDVADYNVLKFIATRRFKAAAQEEGGEDHVSDYEDRVRKLRDEKKSGGEKSTPEEDEDEKPTPEKPKAPAKTKVEKPAKKADNSGKAK